eukprot:scaffold213092_cov26-Prasinocladus_malaysianus.AAC.1
MYAEGNALPVANSKVDTTHCILQVEVLSMAPSTNWGSMAAAPVPLAVPEWALTVQPGLNPDPRSRRLVISVSSPAHPPHWLEYNLAEPL